MVLAYISIVLFFSTFKRVDIPQPVPSDQEERIQTAWLLIDRGAKYKPLVICWEGGCYEYLIDDSVIIYKWTNTSVLNEYKYKSKK